MSKYVALLHHSFARASHAKERMFVYFLMSLIFPFIFCVYWLSAMEQNDALAQTQSLAHVVSYYALIVFFSGIIIPHPEEMIADEHILQGYLSPHLLQPFSYLGYWIIAEIAYRAIRSAFSIITIIGIVLLLGPQIMSLTDDILTWCAVIIMTGLAFYIALLIKMCIGCLAFWVHDIRIVSATIDVAIIFLSGGNMPLDFYPLWMEHLARMTPFPYFGYYPTQAIQGTIPITDLVQLIGVELVWAIVVTIVYQFIWRRGVRRYTASGI